MSTHYFRDANVPENWPTFIELDEVRVSLEPQRIQRVSRELELEPLPVQETANAFSFDNLPFETLRAQAKGRFDAEYEDEATAECMAYGTCQSCAEVVGAYGECDCLCHSYV